MIAVVAGVLAGGAALLLLNGGSRLPRRPSRVVPSGSITTGLLVLVGGLVLGLLDGTHLVIGLIALGVVAAAGRELVRRRRAAVAETRAHRLLVTCEGLAADLRAGLPPVLALEAAAEGWAELAPVVAAARLGSDVPAALRSLADRPGAARIRVVAAAWHVAHRSGAGLAAALGAAAAQLREERATARVVAAEMAAARATARLLAAMPLAVLALGSGVGGDPLAFLLDTTAGLVCLGTGLALEYAGLLWLGRIAGHVLGVRR
jgi:tight adherence protein B